MRSDKRYYVLKGGSWFAFEDGHYTHASDFKRATGTDSILEAVRMRGYSNGGRIVTVKLEVEDVDTKAVDREILKAARLKVDREFTADERRVLGL